MSKLNKYSLIDIQAVMDAKEHVFFGLKKQYNVNLIGIRSETEEVNHFDDYLYVIYRNAEENILSREFQITTDPGKHWLNHPMNKDGTAIVVPGQYRGLWCLGKHRNDYMALRQKGKISVYRDDDRDNELDFDPKTIQEGLYGINCHRSNPYTNSYYVDRWSAGCQVHKYVKNFNTMMMVCNRAAKIYGNSFTYSLLEEGDFVSL